MIGWRIINCPIGELIAAESRVGLKLLIWRDKQKEAEKQIGNRLKVSSSRLHYTPELQCQTAVEGFFLNRGFTKSPTLDTSGTAFQRRVWRGLRDIPVGQTWSYGQVARHIGHPAAVRGVAGACASNPVCLFIPCHRVVRANGGLGGYAGGVEIKQALLALEYTVHP